MKRKKEFGGIGGCEQRIEVIVKMQKAGSGRGWGSGPIWGLG